jgi:hypothetical protein
MIGFPSRREAAHEPALSCGSNKALLRKGDPMAGNTRQTRRLSVALGMLAGLAPVWPRAALARPMFAAEFVSNPIPGTYRALALTDLDGDAIPDLVLPVPFSQQVAICRGRGDGTFHEPTAMGTSTS